ncbi:MAG: VTT domain-containing protein [Dehalococcoidales bacterium]
METKARTSKLKRALKRWEFWAGIITIAVTFAISILIVFNWEFVRALEGYGYMGGFFISTLGGATVIVPVPMLAVQFALGGVLNPWFGPAFLTPIFVGIVCGLGETVGALTIYLTGYTGGTPISRTTLNGKPGRIQKAYLRLMRLMERRGPLTLFLLSAIMNPFFYPAALAAGAVRFGIRRYFIICLAGKAIKCTGIAYAGYFGLRGIFSTLGIHI